MRKIQFKFVQKKRISDSKDASCVAVSNRAVLYLAVESCVARVLNEKKQRVEKLGKTKLGQIS